MSRLQGDAVLDLAESAGRSTDCLFNELHEGGIASLPTEYRGGESTGEFDERTESLIGCYYTNNGWASGGSVDEATLHALNELVERDATSNALLSNIFDSLQGRLMIPEDTVLGGIQSAIEKQTGSPVYMVSVPALSGTVVLSICWTGTTDLPPSMGCGASQFSGYAAYRSLLELWQELCADKDSISLEERKRARALRFMTTNYPNLHKALQFRNLPELISRFDKENVFYEIPRPEKIPDVPKQICNITQDLLRYNIHIWRRVAFQANVDNSSCNPSVIQLVAPGLERFHVIRSGCTAEPIGRLRNHDSISAVRSTLG